MTEAHLIDHDIALAMMELAMVDGGGSGERCLDLAQFVELLCLEQAEMHLEERPGRASFQKLPMWSERLVKRHGG